MLNAREACVIHRLDRRPSIRLPLFLPRHQLSLYAHVSKISWEFGAGGRVAGTVSDPVSTDLRHFDLPEGSLSQFEMTNALWDLVAAEGSVQT